MTSNPTAACTGGYVKVAGRTGAVQCGIDRPGNDTSTASTNSLQECETLCATNDQCQIAHFDTTSNTCHQKNYYGTGVHNSSINGIVFYNATYPEYYCTNPAPPSPYLLNGGFEQGFEDFSAYPDASQGRFSQSISSLAYEGCYSL